MTYHPRHLAAQPTHPRQTSRQGLVVFATVALVLLGATPAHAADIVIPRGATLWGIAATYCGSGAKYMDLARANGIKDPSKIYAGAKLNVTCARPATATASRSTPTRTTPAPTGWVSPIPGGRTTDCWGAGRNHKGVDIAAPQGTPIRAAAAGTVSNTGWIGTGYGLEVMVSHGGGVWTHYAHLSRTAVARGQHVTAGQVIGFVGHTGDAHGDHLHFEVATRATIYGTQQNPGTFMRARGAALGGC